MALTKTVSAVDEWQAIAQNAVLEGSTVDVSNAYSAALHIDIALTSTTTHTGTKIAIQVSSNSTGDEDWHTFTEFVGPIGTANTENITNNPLAADSTSATVASTTGTYDDDGAHWIYIKDSTIADSEMIYIVSHVVNTSITWLDGTANSHAQNTPMWDIANRYTIDIPLWASRVRIVYDNTHDSDGASVDVSARISAVTGV
jgi:hypothetical protein